MTVEMMIVQGESWGHSCTLTDDSGNPIDVSHATITGSVRDGCGNLVSQLTFSLGASIGSFFAIVTETQDWPLGRLICEIEILINGVTFIPPPFRITVERNFV